MKEEKPIIFTAESVNAIRDGRKTQTRRVVTLTESGRVKEIGGRRNWHLDDSNAVLASPYQVGDRLWVRETWQHYGWNEDGIPFIQYAADNAKRMIEDIPEDWEERLINRWADLSDRDNYNIDNRAADRKWRSPIFMPRWASRITLEVTAVRVEQLQDISEADARTEGYVYSELHKMHEEAAGMSLMTMPHDPRLWFRTKWDEINGKRAPWESNSWVWVIEFKALGPSATTLPVK